MPPTGYQLLVFDLDGTLADTREDIAASLNAALAGLGRPPLALDEVTRLVGDGARVLLERALGSRAGPDLVQRGLDEFLAHYTENCLASTRLYPAVADTLESLAAKDLAVLTNKPRGPTQRILRGLGIERRFRWVQAGDDRWPKKPEPAGLLHLVAAAGCGRERALFVGDSGVDLATGRNAGVDVAFVTYGFRPDALEAGGARYVLDGFAELVALVGE